MKKMRKYEVVEEIPGCSLFPWPYAWRGWTSGIKKYVGKVFTAGVTLLENGNAKHCWHPEDAVEMANATIQKARDQKWVKWIRDETYEVINKAMQFSENEIVKADLTKKTNQELLEIYMEANLHIEQLYSVGLVPSTMDMGHNLFSDMLAKYVDKRGKEVGLSIEEIGEAFSALTTVEKKTIEQQQEEDFLKLLAEISGSEQLKNLILAGKWMQANQIKEKLEVHSSKYGWLSRGYEGQITWTAQYFAELLKSELKQGTNSEKKLQQLELTRRGLLEKQKTYEQKLKMNADFQHYFNVARIFTVVKSDRKDAVLTLYWRLDKLMKEISRRLSITEKQSRYILPDDMKTALASGKVDEKELLARQKLSYILVVGEKTRVFTGREAEDFIKNQLKAEEGTTTSELVGHCACPGKASGVVKIIAIAADMAKMNKGDILVAHMTNPELVPAMKKAAAIVCDLGGITSHAAIVSRELGIPCVTGTKFATKALKDGNRVEVDATKGIVKKIS